MYVRHWHNYRRRRAVHWLLFLSYIPLTVAAHALTDSTTISFTVALILFWGWFIAGQMLLWWKCPRCHRPFHGGMVRGNVFAKRCLHCGLRRYEPAPKAQYS